MPVMQELSKDHPLRKSWEAFKMSEEYENSKRWAGAVIMTTEYRPDGVPVTLIEHKHLEGSLWALFMAGWNAAMNGAVAAIPAPPQPSADDDQEARARG